MAESDANRYTIPNLDRALTVLEYLARHPEGAGISAISAELKVPLNSVFRIAETLWARDYLYRDLDSKRYYLGRKLLTLGYAAVAGGSLAEKAIPVMHTLRDELGETVLLGVLTHHEGVVLDQVPARHPVKVQVDLGIRFPLYSAAPGKAFLANLPAPEREAILDAMVFQRFTEKTITNRADLEVALEECRSTGYGCDRGEEMTGINCVGSAILDHRGYPIGAIWITGPAFRLPLERIDEVGRRVAEAVAGVTRQFGGDPQRRDHADAPSLGAGSSSPNSPAPHSPGGKTRSAKRLRDV